MAARTTMANLILTMRGMCDVGTDDVTIGGVSYWSDNHIQDVLDSHRLDVWNEPLYIIPSYAGGGSAVYKDYQSEFTNYEETDSGTAIFIVEDAAGNDITTGFTPDYQRGHLTFTSDTSGTVYYLTGRSYDLNGAAADIWRRKASHYASSFSFSTDNHRVDRGALINNAAKMADMYDRMAMPKTSTIYRSDVDDTAFS